MHHRDKPTVLIVDDEPKMVRALQIVLQEDGRYLVKTATDYYQAIEHLKSPVDLVLTDLTMPGKNGLELLGAIKKERPNLPVILMTAYSTVESAILALKEGANDYLQKPFDGDDLLKMLSRFLPVGHEPLTEAEPLFRDRFGDMIGQSSVIQNVYHRIQRAAETDSTVLITGESGTGKELVAKAVHYSGARKSKPFIAINCAALPEALLESELFGHEKGSFTGAFRTKEGKFELAHQGTVFLDEVGEMPLALQVKLLRVIQEKEFERVGGSSTVKVNIRLIAATHRNLEEAVKTGAFREDLYYRLHVLTIHVPPLRQRREDLPLLIEHFLAEKSRKAGVLKKELHAEAKEFLLGYHYPGNIRELENLLERAVIISNGPMIERLDFPLPMPTLFSPYLIPLENGLAKLETTIEEIEKDLILRAIQSYPEKSNTELAEFLGTSRRILESRIKHYGLTKK